MKYTLCIGDQNLSSWSLRGWLAVKAAGEPFETVKVALDQPTTRKEILRYSPSGRVPALSDGETTLWDSMAICEYMAETFPKAQLWPSDPKARAWARSICAEMHSGFPALREHFPMHCWDADMKRRKQIPEKVQADIDRICEIWRETRQKFGTGGKLLFGSFTLADAYYAPVCIRFKTYELKIDPVSKSYVDAVWELPWMKEWLEGAKKEISAKRT